MVCNHITVTAMSTKWLESIIGMLRIKPVKDMRCALVCACVYVLTFSFPQETYFLVVQPDHGVFYNEIETRYKCIVTDYDLKLSLLGRPKQLIQVVLIRNVFEIHYYCAGFKIKLNNTKTTV